MKFKHFKEYSSQQNFLNKIWIQEVCELLYITVYGGISLLLIS